MLPAYIIEEILERQRERARRGEVFVEPPPPDRTLEHPLAEELDEEDPDCGFAIIDYSV